MAKSNTPKIAVNARDRTGSRYAARLRKDGQLPAVIYGHNQDPVHVSLDTRQITDLLHRNVHVLEVEYNNSKSEPCLIKDVQWDHLGARIVHLDLTRVDLSERVTTEVAIVIFGEAIGLKTDGAILTHPHDVIEVECEVANIPESITVDVTELALGTPLTVADLPLPPGVQCTAEPETVIASITIVAADPEEEEATKVDEGEGPEVIGGKTKDETAAGEKPAEQA